MSDLLTVIRAWSNENRETYGWDAEFGTWRRWTGQYWRALSPKSGEIMRAVSGAIQASGKPVNGWEAASSGERMARLCLERQFSHAVAGLVSFTNGTAAPIEWLKGVSGGAPILRPNDPGDNLTFGLPYPLAEEPDAMPATERLLCGLLADEGDRRVIYTHLGMALLRDITMRRSLWVQGPQMCGKSTLLYLANSVCGADEPRKNAGPRIFKLSDEEADRQRQRNRERLLVTIDEMPPSLHEYEEGFKLLSAHGGVQYRAHHSMPDDGVWLPKLLIVSNNRPSFLDRAGAFESRLVYLSATGVGQIGSRDPSLFDAIKEELPSVAWMCLFYSATLLVAGETDYPLTDRVRAEFRDVADDGNGIRQWLRERCVIGGNDEVERVPINDLRDDYRAWAERDSRKPVTAVLLREQLEALKDELGIRVFNTQRRYSVGGLRLRGPMERDGVAL